MSKPTPHGPLATVVVVNDDVTRINVLLTVSDDGKGFPGMWTSPARSLRGCGSSSAWRNSLEGVSCFLGNVPYFREGRPGRLDDVHDPEQQFLLNLKECIELCF